MRNRLALSLLLLASPLAAQTQRGFCFRAEPLARCRSFAVFEMTGALRLTSTTHADPYSGREKDLGEFVAWDVGYMRNRDSSHAVGLSLEGGGSGGGTRFALQARRRTWLMPALTLDLTAGPIAAQAQSAEYQGTAQGFGMTTSAMLGAGDLIGLGLGADYVRIQNRNTGALYLQGKLGSHAAVGASAVALVGLVLLIRALSEAAY